MTHHLPSEACHLANLGLTKRLWKLAVRIGLLENAPTTPMRAKPDRSRDSNVRFVVGRDEPDRSAVPALVVSLCDLREDGSRKTLATLLRGSERVGHANLVGIEQVGAMQVLDPYRTHGDPRNGHNPTLLPGGEAGIPRPQPVTIQGSRSWPEGRVVFQVVRTEFV